MGSAVEQKAVGSADDLSEAESSRNRLKGSNSAVTHARGDGSSRATQWQGPPQTSYHRKGRHSAGSMPRSASASTSGRQNGNREPSPDRLDNGQDDKRAGSRKSFDSRQLDKRGGNGRGLGGRHSQKAGGGPGYGHGSRDQSKAVRRENAKDKWRGRIEGKPGSQDSRLREDREGGTETLVEVRAVLVTMPLMGLLLESRSLRLLLLAGKPWAK